MIIFCQVLIILQDLEDYWGMLYKVRAANLNTEEIANILDRNENIEKDPVEEEKKNEII